VSLGSKASKKRSFEFGRVDGIQSGYWNYDLEKKVGLDMSR
jgi:hypothetical protein